MDGQAYNHASHGGDEMTCDAMPPYVTGSQRSRIQEKYTHAERRSHDAWEGEQRHRYSPEYANSNTWPAEYNRDSGSDRNWSPSHTTHHPDRAMFFDDRQHSDPPSLRRPSYHRDTQPIQYSQPQYPDIQTHRPEISEQQPHRNSRVYASRLVGETQSYYTDSPHSGSSSEHVATYTPSEQIYSKPSLFSCNSSLSDHQTTTTDSHRTHSYAQPQQQHHPTTHRDTSFLSHASSREYGPGHGSHLLTSTVASQTYSDPIRKAPLERQHSFPPRTRAQNHKEPIDSPMSLTPFDHNRPSDAMSHWDGSSQRNEQIGSQSGPYDREFWTGSPVRGWDRSPPNSAQSFAFPLSKESQSMEQPRRIPVRRFTLASELSHRSASFPDVNIGPVATGPGLVRRSPPPPGHPYTTALHTSKRNPANLMVQDAESACGNEKHVRDLPENSAGGQQQPLPPPVRKIDRRWGRKGSISVDMSGFVRPEPARPENSLLEEVRRSFASVCKNRGDVSLVMRVVVGIHKTSDFCDEMNSYSWSTHLGCIQKLLGMLPEERKGCDYHEATVRNIVRFWAEKLMRYGDRQGRAT